MFTPQVYDGPVVGSRHLSPRASAKRRDAIGMRLVADNGTSLLTYIGTPPVVASKSDPIELEALRLAETIRTEHKRVSASCSGRGEFEVREWSSQDVFYRALAILNKEGMRLANMRTGTGAGMMSLSFFDVPAVEPEEERSVWDMLPSDCNP